MEGVYAIIFAVHYPAGPTCGNQLYERKHNPFISYQDIQSNPARVANIVDFGQFATDLANNTVPDFSWISPDQCHDMHGRELLLAIPVISPRCRRSLQLEMPSCKTPSARS